MQNSTDFSPVTDNAAGQRYEMNIDGRIVFANYRLDGATLTISHVEAPPALRGTGAAGRLMREVMNLARTKGWTVRPTCGYAAGWIERHPEYHDLRA